MKSHFMKIREDSDGLQAKQHRMSSLSSSTNNHQTPSTSTQPSAPPLPQYSGLKTPSTSTTSSSSHQMALLNLNSINNNKSVLLVNVKELNLRVYNEIIVSWNILEATSMHDWIGLFKSEIINIYFSYCGREDLSIMTFYLI